MSDLQDFGDAMDGAVSSQPQLPDFGAALDKGIPAEKETPEPVIANSIGAPQLGSGYWQGQMGAANWFRRAGESALSAPVTAAADLTARIGTYFGLHPGDWGTKVHDFLQESPSPESAPIDQAQAQLMAPVGRGINAADQFIGTHFGPTAQYGVEQGVGILGDIVAMSGAVPEIEGPMALFRSGEEAGDFASRARAAIAASRDPSQSISAAAAAPDLSRVSPEGQQAIVAAAQKNGGAVNPDAVARHAQAESLPVPVQLTRGQALQDPVALSEEMNQRGKFPEVADRLHEQNQNLAQNMQALRDEVGPEVFSASPVEHGDTLIQAYKEKDAAAQAAIKAKYQALADANGGDLPMDGVSFVDAATAALHKQMKAPFLPTGVRSVLNGISDDGQMTLENFENLRTTLAAEARKAERSGDGNAAAAVSIVRNQLENMPVTSDVAEVKALADQARAAAKARFDALRADPAYNAAVNDSVPPDRFVQKFITGPTATRDGVATMQANLAGNPVAQQTMGVSAIDHLRRTAGIDDMGNGNFSQAAYNKTLQAMGPKLPALVPPKTINTLQDVGDVARYTQAQPRGSYVNNSNTLTGALSEHVAGVAEGAANALAHGLPVGTLTRKALKGRAGKAWVRKTLEPYAGVGELQPR